MSSNDLGNGCQVNKFGYEDRLIGSTEQSERWYIQRQYIFIMVWMDGATEAAQR